MITMLLHDPCVASINAIIEVHAPHCIARAEQILPTDQSLQYRKRDFLFRKANDGRLLILSVSVPGNVDYHVHKLKM